ncbi:MAG: RNase H1/viroplasmin domain-containing protein [Lachnospiraceae bacterium]|nr:hypothetical protein [Lachnospiraceae bacterium]MDE7057962.1 RNase H1/viroplasmin domain-containing protein [Lachnospiraceae bacterium]
MSKNNYWVLLLKGEEPKLFTSWLECEQNTHGASRAVWKGFPTKDEAIKHAKALGWSELTIIYDSELIPWAYRGCGEKMLTQAAGQYMYDIREKIKIEVKSINGVSHTSEEDPGITLVDKLARKGAGIVD